MTSAKLGKTSDQGNCREGDMNLDLNPGVVVREGFLEEVILKRRPGRWIGVSQEWGIRPHSTSGRETAHTKVREFQVRSEVCKVEMSAGAAHGSPGLFMGTLTLFSAESVGQLTSQGVIPIF